MNINAVDQFLLFILNKVQTGNATPERRNDAYNGANVSLFKRYDGIIEKLGRGEPAMAYSQSVDIEKVMRLFKKSVTLYINPLGIANVPSDFIKESTLLYTMSQDGVIKENPIAVCNDQEFQEAQNSYVVPATKEDPVCNFIGTTIRFLPKDLINASMIYLRMPVTPVWGYTTTSNRAVYDVTTSVQPEWPDDLFMDFVMLAAQYLGVNMQRNDMVAYSEQFKQQGQ